MASTVARDFSLNANNGTRGAGMGVVVAPGLIPADACATILPGGAGGALIAFPRIAPYTITGGGVSVELWLCSTTPPSGIATLLIGGADASLSLDAGLFGGYWLYAAPSGKVTFTANNNGSVGATSRVTLYDGIAHHIVGTYDMTALRLYVDGLLMCSTPYAAASIGGYDGALGINLCSAGSSGSGAVAQPNAAMSEVAVYAAALTAAQVAKHYAAAGRPTLVAAAIVTNTVAAALGAGAKLIAGGSNATAAAASVSGKGHALLGAGADLAASKVQGAHAAAVVDVRVSTALPAAGVLTNGVHLSSGAAAILACSLTLPLAAETAIAANARVNLPLAATIANSENLDLGAAAFLAAHHIAATLDVGALLTAEVTGPIDAAAVVQATTTAELQAGAHVSAAVQGTLDAGAITGASASGVLDVAALLTATPAPTLGAAAVILRAVVQIAQLRAAALIAVPTVIAPIGAAVNLSELGAATIGAGARVAAARPVALDAQAIIVGNAHVPLAAAAVIINRPATSLGAFVRIAEITKTPLHAAARIGGHGTPTPAHLRAGSYLVTWRENFAHAHAVIATVFGSPPFAPPPSVEAAAYITTAADAALGAGAYLTDSGSTTLDAAASIVAVPGGTLGAQTAVLATTQAMLGAGASIATTAVIGAGSILSAIQSTVLGAAAYTLSIASQTLSAVARIVIPNPGVYTDRTIRVRVVQRLVDVRPARIYPRPRQEPARDDDGSANRIIAPASPTSPTSPTPTVADEMTFTQATPVGVWVIAHTLGHYPSVTTVGVDKDRMLGDVSYPEPNVVVITFSQPVAGIAYLV